MVSGSIFKRFSLKSHLWTISVESNTPHLWSDHDKMYEFTLSLRTITLISNILRKLVLATLNELRCDFFVACMMRNAGWDWFSGNHKIVGCKTLLWLRSITTDWNFQNLFSNNVFNVKRKIISYSTGASKINSFKSKIHVGVLLLLE